MIRIIVRGVGTIPTGDWPTETWVKTFDIEAPELQAYLEKPPTYGGLSIIGGEVLSAKPEGGEGK